MPAPPPPRDIAAERVRIDIAMAKFETAKQKANAQRTEYAKYLTWKTNLQRKERKQREEEEELLRQRVEEKLTEILQIHKDHKRAELNQYRHFATQKVRRQQPPNIPNSLAQEEQIQAEAAMERERRKSEWQQTRLELSRRNQSAPANFGSSPRGGGRQADSTFVPMQPSAPKSGGSPLTSLAPSPPKLDADGTEQYDAALMDHKPAVMEHLLRSTGPLKKSLRGDQKKQQQQQTLVDGAEDNDPTSIDLQLEARDRRRQELSNVERKLEKVQERADLMKAMYLKARTRRMYAQGRIAADPPADYLVGTDIFKYIPADLLPGGAGGTAQGLPGGTNVGGSAGDAFFLTEMGEDGTVRPSSSTPERHPTCTVRGRDGDLVTLTLTSSPRRRRLQQHLSSRSHSATGGGPSGSRLVQERFPEEEAAMYAHHIALSGNNSGTQRTSHAMQPPSTSPNYGMGGWSRHEKFKLPPVSSIRFVDK